MAERRMFAKSIVLSDAFLDMPLSARCLYFTLGMLADDDGFVGSPKSIMRQCGASQDDMSILLQKRYVLGFESGVIVIKHWRMNNYLQNDRKKQTTYLDELSQLVIDQRGAYTEKSEIGLEQIECTLSEPVNNAMYTECIQNVYTGKDRLGKDRLEKGSTTPTPLPSATEETISRVTSQMIVDLFNEICTSFPKVKAISESRKKAINARLKVYGLEDFRSLFQKAEASSFLKGQNGRDWSATFDWLIKDSNIAKVLDGNYDDKTPVKTSRANFTERKEAEDFNSLIRIRVTDEGDEVE